MEPERNLTAAEEIQKVNEKLIENGEYKTIMKNTKGKNFTFSALASHHNHWNNLLVSTIFNPKDFMTMAMNT